MQDNNDNDITLSDVLDYLKNNMVTKAEFAEALTKSEFAEAMAGITQRLDGINNRIDPLANDVSVLKNKVVDLEGSRP